MKYKFRSIRITITKYDVTFATKREFYPPGLRQWGAKLLDLLKRIEKITCYDKNIN